VFIPLVDILRCVNPHAETWLVASIERAEDRFIIEGTLGCPTCLAEYPIRDGVVYFTKARTEIPSMVPDESEAMRLAAALDLTDPRMTALLQGSWAGHAQLVRGVSPAQLILLNPPPGTTSGDGVSVIVSDRVPLAQQSIDAIAVDELFGRLDEPGAATLPALKRGGRLLAPVSMPIPRGFNELARDDEVWVARVDDREIVSAPILPTRRTTTSS
jgi:uncharacterized protein YbaR (Trm112 family)